MNRYASLFVLPVVAALVPFGVSGSLVPIGQLGLETPTRVVNATGAIANAAFSDSPVNDGDANVDSTADFAFAWEMTFLKTDPDPISSRRSLVEFGGGTTGLTVSWVGDQVSVQHQNGAVQLGGDGSGTTGALAYTVTGADIGVERTWAVSIDMGGGTTTLNMFVDSQLVGSVTGGSSADWAGGDNGAFWGRSGTILLETFGSGSGAVGPDGNDATVNLTTGLRLYEDTVLTAVPEPSVLGLGLGGLLVLRVLRRR